MKKRNGTRYVPTEIEKNGTLIINYIIKIYKRRR